MKKIKNKPWYNNAVAICIGALCFVLLTHLPQVIATLKTFINFFAPVIVACIIAYIVNPLAKLFSKRLPVKSSKLRNIISNVLSYITIIILIGFFLAVLIPQLIDSLTMLSENLPSYAKTAEETLNNLGLTKLQRYIHNTFSSTEKIISTISQLVQNNSKSVAEASVAAGKGIINFFIAFLLSMYILSDKKRLKTGFYQLINLSLNEKHRTFIFDFLKKSHSILNRYIVYNFLDSFIVGLANLTIMLILRMPYAGLISFIIAITNLLPTFGPMIGGGIGALLLLMVDPWQAAAFIAITLAIQTVDAYIIKPKLFGNSLGVSGLWILIGIVVGGRMFGLVGILIAIPIVAILDYLYKDYLIPYLQNKKSDG